MERVAINRDAGMIAYEINIIKDQTIKFLLQSSIEIGSRLKEAKAMVGHGNWEKWLENEVSYSKRTASNLMRVSDEYSDCMIDDTKRNLISDLNYTQAIAMLKLDSDERDDFLIENDVNDMTVNELNNAIKEKLAIKVEKDALEEKLKALEDKEGKAAKLLEGKLDQIHDLYSLVKEKTDEVSKLKSSLKKAGNLDVDLDDLADLQSEIDESKITIENKDFEIMKLKEKLLEKPKEVEVQQIAYEVPPAVLRELDDLKAKLGASESEVRFRATFELLLNSFNDLVEVLGTMEGSENYEIYKNAINKLLNKLVIEN